MKTFTDTQVDLNFMKFASLFGANLEPFPELMADEFTPRFKYVQANDLYRAWVTTFPQARAANDSRHISLPICLDVLSEYAIAGITLGTRDVEKLKLIVYCLAPDAFPVDIGSPTPEIIPGVSDALAGLTIRAKEV